MPEHKTNNILWLDLETTGDAPHADSILEVGAVLTDWNMDELWNVNMVVNFPNKIYLADEYDPGYGIPRPVWDMHTVNGLWRDCNAATYTLYDVDATIAYTINRLSFDKPVYLAGSGVSHFDIRFIQHYLPTTLAHLKRYSSKTVPTADIGCMRRFVELTCPEITVPDFKSRLTHRAIDDVRDHLDEARWWRAQLLKGTAEAGGL